MHSRFRLAALSLLLATSSACSSAPRTPPLVPDPEPPRPIAPDEPTTREGTGEPSGDERLPRSIRRLVDEEREEVRSIATLAAELSDPRGRTRALDEARALEDELQDIETSLAATREDDGDALDQLVVRLQRLTTRTALMHDALFQAAR